MLCTEYSCRSYGSCMAAGPTESESHEGLGLCSVSHHSSAAYIASLCASGFGDAQNPHLSHTVDLFASVSAPHAASWLLVTPFPGLNLHLDPNELQISIQWWLGIDTTRSFSCSLCPGLALDRLGNHAITWKRGGDVVTRHNHLHNVIVEFAIAHLGVRVESGSGI